MIIKIITCWTFMTVRILKCNKKKQFKKLTLVFMSKWHKKLYFFLENKIVNLNLPSRDFSVIFLNSVPNTL